MAQVYVYAYSKNDLRNCLRQKRLNPALEKSIQPLEFRSVYQYDGEVNKERPTFDLRLSNELYAAKLEILV